MTRKLLTLSLFAAGLVALLLFLAQSDTVSADAPTAITQADTVAEDASVVIDLEATLADKTPCAQLTFATAGLQGGTLGAITDAACGEASSGAPCTVTLDCDTATVTFTPDADLFTVSSTLLAPGIDSVQTTIPITSTTGFAPSGRIRIDSEFIDYTGTTATSVTGATRGAAGSTAATHATGAAVDQGQGFFTYTAAHGATLSTSVDVVITITTVNDTPVAPDQSETTTPGAAKSITLTATDKETCELTIATTGVTNGTLSAFSSPATNCTSNLPATDSTPHSDTATVTFTPTPATFIGNGTITWTATDAGAAVDTGIVTISVNTQPTADSQTVNVTQDAAKTITLTGSDVDPANTPAAGDNCQLTFAITTQPANGSLGGIVGSACVSGSPNTDSATVLYTPNTGFSGGDSFAFTVDDDTGAANSTSAAGTITIEIAVGVDGLTAGQAAASANLKLTTTQTDVPGATLTLATPGTYMITGVFDFDAGPADDILHLVGRLVVGSTTQASEAIMETDFDDPRATVSQTWVITTTAADTVIKLQALKTAGSGGSQVRVTHTTITAVGPF